MPIFIVLWKFKKWIAIAIFIFLYLMQIAYTNHLAGKLKKAEAACAEKIQKIEQANLKALAEKQNEINKVSADYEQANLNNVYKLKLSHVKFKKLLNVLFITIFVSMMTACSNSTVLSPPLPANLLEPCANLQELEAGTGKAVMLWSVDTVAKYNECKLRHSKLVEAVK